MLFYRSLSLLPLTSADKFFPKRILKLVFRDKGFNFEAGLLKQARRKDLNPYHTINLW